MKILVHIGPDLHGTDRFQQVLHAKRDQLLRRGVLYARTPGAGNHSRLYMASSAPEAVDSLRFNRGFASAEKQARLRETLAEQLAREVAKARPDLLVLSAHQLGSCLHSRNEFNTLRDILKPISSDIGILAHLDDPARMLLRRYAAQLFEGRSRSLRLELDLLAQPDWWQAACATRPEAAPEAGQFPEVQGAAFWLDYVRLQQEWEAVFGQGSVRFRSLDSARLYSDQATQELREALDLTQQIGRAEPAEPPVPPSAATLGRARRMNDVLLRFLARRDAILPRPLWRQILADTAVPGVPDTPGALSDISKRFQLDITRLCDIHPGLDPKLMAPSAPAPIWQEAEPTLGFRPTQYLMAHLPRIEKATREARQSEPRRETIRLSASAQRHLPKAAIEALVRLKRSPFAPHNDIGTVDEQTPAAPFTAQQHPAPAPGSSGNVIVGCMKNEAPYIVEWVAYHRTIGFDNFLIYTNGCEDGTSQILDRMQALGILQHRANDDWRGKSPQQHALDRSLTEPVVQNADWIAHIDVDEFVNIRCGNGTLTDLFAHMPGASNVAMTWRLFGHGGVQRIEDRFVIGQFDRCAPAFCPKPHTVWGFKTLFRNLGAYGKISCHRPNKLTEGFENRVKWVNGSGQDMTGEALKNGWRNSRRSIGYDLVQLNHYALRSAESFLIKRQRGRALHVDRSIGLNYWIRMDWSDVRDVTIQRNLPRLRQEYDRLLSDDTLRQLHADGLEWHRAKARELHQTPEFEDLYHQALSLRLTPDERVAYALALDLES